MNSYHGIKYLYKLDCFLEPRIGSSSNIWYIVSYARYKFSQIALQNRPLYSSSSAMRRHGGVDMVELEENEVAQYMSHGPS